MALTPLLALLPCLAAVSAQGNFGSLGSSGFPGISTSGGPFAQVPVRTTYTPQSFPSVQGQQHQQKATIRAKNNAGDKLFLTIEEVADFTDPSQAFGGLLSPYFRRNPFQRGSRRAPDLRVHGFFIKAGAKTGITSPGSLSGTFVMMIMTNGNTAGSCIAIGEPYVPRSQRRGQQLLFGPGRHLGGVGSPFGSLFGARNPFLQATNAYLQQQQTAAVVSTPLQANAKTATIEGRLPHVAMSEIFGRGFAVCADSTCKQKTDMCGIVARDTLSIEEFYAYKHHQSVLIHAQSNLGNSNLFDSIENEDDDHVPNSNLFGGAGTTDVANPSIGF